MTVTVNTFSAELQVVASELNLTKNILTSATEEQLSDAFSQCTVEVYRWETSEASFLIKDNEVKGARLFDNGEEIELLSNGLTPESLFLDFKENAVKL